MKTKKRITPSRTSTDIVLEILDLEDELDECYHDDPFTSIPLFIIEERSKIVDKLRILRQELEDYSKNPD